MAPGALAPLAQAVDEEEEVPVCWVTYVQQIDVKALGNLLRHLSEAT